VAKKKTEDDVAEKSDTSSLAQFLMKELNKGKPLPVSFHCQDASPTDSSQYFSTGSDVLDYCISNNRGGGIPIGKLTEICG